MNNTLPTPGLVIDKVCEEVGILPKIIRAKAKVPGKLQARRLAIMVWEQLGGTHAAIAPHLRIEPAAATALVSNHADSVNTLRPKALAIAAVVKRLTLLGRS